MQTSDASRRGLYGSSASLIPQKSDALFYVIELVVLDAGIIALKIKRKSLYRYGAMIVAIISRVL